MATKEKLLNKRLGRAIARKREHAGLTQEQVAESLHVGNEAVSRMERGTVAASVYRLHELAEVFDCGVEEFLVETSRRPAEQVERILQMLEPLSTPDRQLLVSLVEKLSTRLQKAPANPRKDKQDDTEYLV